MLCVFCVFISSLVDSNPILVSSDKYYIVETRFLNLFPSSGDVVSCSNNDYSVYVYSCMFDTCTTSSTALYLYTKYFELINTVFKRVDTSSWMANFDCYGVSSSVISCICMTQSEVANEATAKITGLTNINSINASQNVFSNSAICGIILYSAEQKNLRYSNFEKCRNSLFCVLHLWSTNALISRCTFAHNSYDTSHYGIYHNHESYASSQYVNFFFNMDSALYSGSAVTFLNCKSDNSIHTEATLVSSFICHIYSNCSINDKVAKEPTVSMLKPHGKLFILATLLNW